MPYESRCRPTSPPTTAAPQFSVPVDVASHTGAMQAQEHRIQRWAVATRTRNPSQEALMSCFSQRITRIRRTESTWKSPEPRITRITRILHSSFFTSEFKNSCNSCNLNFRKNRLNGLIGASNVHYYNTLPCSRFAEKWAANRLIRGYK